MRWKGGMDGRNGRKRGGSERGGEGRKSGKEEMEGRDGKEGARVTEGKKSKEGGCEEVDKWECCLLYTSPSPRDS